VGPILQRTLFEPLETAVLTSATLAVGGGFDYMRRRLGLEHVREVVLPSHFDYQKQALFYVPPDLPDPRTPQFAAKAADRGPTPTRDHTRTRLRALYQLRADERGSTSACLANWNFPCFYKETRPRARYSRNSV